MVSTARASDFLATHARVLDHRRADLALGGGSAESALSALAAYRNPDGGYGWGLEPDLRAPGSQPAGALHGFEVFEEIAPLTSPLAGDLCDWLASAALPGGGLPFALPGADGPGTAPLWAAPDPPSPSLHMTAAVAGSAHRVGRHDRALAEHPWLERATRYCLEAIAGLERPRSAYELLFALDLLDVLAEADAHAEAELRRVAAFLPASGTMAVQGGKPDEALRPLDFSPRPDRPLRSLLDPRAIGDDLDRLEAGQDRDGGWRVDFADWSPAGALEWRGYMTVRAIQVLAANGRLVD